MERGACLAFSLAVMMVACVSLHAAPALAGKRVALVIGNNDYENVPALKKAVNDAGAISQELARLGFDVVSAENVGRRAMSRALVELESKIETGDTALIYFAGHGFAVDGTNYLLPVDVPEAGPGEEGLVRDASFAASGLSDRLQEKGAATVILILDACRDNPFAIKGKRSMGLTRGLSRMDPAEGMFVLFSAGQGQSALDRLSETDENPNSVFTRTLLKEMEQPGQSMVQIAKRTQSKVKELAAKVDHVQVPAYYDQIVGDLYLVPEGAALAKGSVDTLQEGGGTSVLPPQEQKLAALPASPQPIASFTRSNSGWMVNVSLPEAATQFGYRVGDKGDFTDAGLLDVLDQRTGRAHAEDLFRDGAGPGQDHDLRHLARQARRAGRRGSHQFRSDRSARRGAEEAPRAVLDELDRVSRMAGDDGLFHPSRHLSLRHQGSALRLRRRAGRQDVQASALRRRRPAQRAGERHALYEGAAEDRVDAGAAHLCRRHAVAGAELQRA